MGTKYTATAVTGYNATPPADDASQTAANQIFWSTIKTKLGDPLNTFASGLDVKILAALDTSARKITASDTTLTSDHLRTIEIGSTVSTGITVSLGDAASMAAGYIVTINNQSLVAQTVGRITSANTIDGVAGNLTISPLTAVTLKVNQGVTGYMSEAIGMRQKVIRFTRAHDAVSGNVAYTGFGFKPKSLVFFATVNATREASWGMSTIDLVNQLAIYDVQAVAGTYGFAQSLVIILDEQTGVKSQAAIVLSADTDGFTLTWTRTGASAAGTIEVAVLGVG